MRPLGRGAVPCLLKLQWRGRSSCSEGPRGEGPGQQQQQEQEEEEEQEQEQEEEQEQEQEQEGGKGIVAGAVMALR